MVALTAIFRGLGRVPWYWWVILFLLTSNGVQQHRVTKWRTKTNELQGQIETAKARSSDQAARVETVIEYQTRTLDRVVERVKRVEVPVYIASDCTASVEWLRLEIPKAQPW